MSVKARVQDDGDRTSGGHALVGLFVGGDDAGWALLGHLRPRAGGECDDVVRGLAGGMPVEDAHRQTLTVRAAPDRRPLTPADVGVVCEAAGLVREARDWADPDVSVDTVTESCLPIGPDDPRPCVGIFVWSRVSDRREDLSTSCSPALLRAVIEDVRAYPGPR